MTVYKCLLGNPITRFFEERRDLNAADALSKKLDEVERIPVRFNAGVADVDDNLFVEAQAVIDSLKKYRSERAAIRLHQVALRQIALKYRCKKGKKGGPADLATTFSLAKEWKARGADPNKELSDIEAAQIREACKYNEFAALLLADKNLRNDFFKWSLRDNNSVKAFIYFPAVCRRLKSCLLAGRIGRLGKNILKARKRDDKRELTLPFEVKKNAAREISILDEEAEVVLRKKRVCKIRDIFREFADKNLRVGEVEIFGVNGISNWNSLLLARKTPFGYQWLDLTDRNYWKKMPVFEELTESEIKRRYAVAPRYAKREFLIAVKSTREGDSLDLDKSHGFLDVLVPGEKEGVYRLFPFGKFAARFPTGFLEKSFFVTDTVVARIEYPDENSFYSHRQQAIVPFVISGEKGLELMEMIRKELIAAREDNIVFMFSWENCAYWPQTICEKLLEGTRQVPDFFRTHLLVSRPSFEPLKTFFKFLRLLPECVRLITMKLFRYPFRCQRDVWVRDERGQKVFKSSMSSPFARTFSIYLPSLLHEKILKKEIRGKVLYGNAIYAKEGE